jgi:hypothetical protein
MYLIDGLLPEFDSAKMLIKKSKIHRLGMRVSMSNS